MPRPKCDAHRRFTITRAVRGFVGLAIHSASAVRRPVLGAPEAALGTTKACLGSARIVGIPGSIPSPGFWYSPRTSNDVGGGLASWS